jgi:hypothetical protein
MSNTVLTYEALWLHESASLWFVPPESASRANSADTPVGNAWALLGKTQSAGGECDSMVGENNTLWLKEERHAWS